MFKFIAFCITVPLTLFVLLFAVSNTQETTVTLNLFDLSYSLPQYTVSLGLMGLGFLVGAVLVWLNLYPYRIKYWHTNRKLTKATEQIENLEKQLVQASETLEAEPADTTPVIRTEADENRPKIAIYDQS